MKDEEEYGDECELKGKWRLTGSVDFVGVVVVFEGRMD
jgi:hypothetical protein